MAFIQRERNLELECRWHRTKLSLSSSRPRAFFCTGPRRCSVDLPGAQRLGSSEVLHGMMDVSGQFPLSGPSPGFPSRGRRLAHFTVERHKSKTKDHTHEGTRTPRVELRGLVGRRWMELGPISSNKRTWLQGQQYGPRASRALRPQVLPWIYQHLEKY